MRIKAQVRNVRDTAEGKAISAYVVLNKKCKDVATIHVHHSTNNKGYVKRIDVFEPSIRDGFNQYKGQTIPSALHRAVICGVRLYDDASTGPETQELLEKLQVAKSETARHRILLRAERLGMTWVDPFNATYRNLHFVGGLNRLQFFGFKVIQVL